MPYKPDNLTKLNIIINFLKEDKISEALPEFKGYLNDLDIGNYSIKEWNQEWRRKAYKFGEVFIEKDATKFISIIEDYLKDNEDSNPKKEAAEFIYSEILWNYFEQGSTYVADLLKGLIKKYSTNPEFHNTYSHFLQKNGNYDLCIDESFLAYKMDSYSPFFQEVYFNKCKGYINLLLSRGKIDQAQNIVPKIKRAIKEPHRDHVFNNIIVSLEDRIADHRIISQRIEGISEIAQKTINHSLDRERGKFIEIMGFFVAILGFVFINVNLAISSLRFNEILLVMVGMTIILAFFATLVSILFKSKITTKDFFSDVRFWIIIILVITFIIYVYKVQV